MEDNRPEPVQLTAHLSALTDAVSAGRPVPTGRLFGLPELPDNDYWVDIAGTHSPAPADTSTGCTGPGQRSPRGRRGTTPTHQGSPLNYAARSR
jgi:hypothetical protein